MPGVTCAEGEPASIRIAGESPGVGVILRESLAPGSYDGSD